MMSARVPARVFPALHNAALNKCRLSVDPESVIQGFPHKRPKRLFKNGDRKGVRADYVEKLENILAVLIRARAAENMNLPGFRLLTPKGGLTGFHAVTIRANYP